MRLFLLCCIRLYWRIPAAKRRRCLFKESCPRYMYRVAKQEGFVKAVQALRMRMRQCRAGYSSFTAADGRDWVLLNDGTVVSKTDTVL
jgi:uncharacterized protein